MFRSYPPPLSHSQPHPQLGVGNTNHYLSGIAVDEEYRYVLERQNQQQMHLVGNSMQRPSFLVKPLKVGDTDTRTQRSKKGGRFRRENVGHERRRRSYDDDDDDDDDDYREHEELGGYERRKNVQYAYADQLSAQTAGILLLDVTPLSLGIEIYGGFMITLIQKNSVIPTKNSEFFTTFMAQQNSVTISIYQGERPMAIDNKFIDSLQLSLDSSPPSSKKPKIEVSLEIDANGRLTVSAHILGTGDIVSIQVGPDDMRPSQEEIDAVLDDEEDNAMRDANIWRRIELLTEKRLPIYSHQSGDVSATQYVMDFASANGSVMLTNLAPDGDDGSIVIDLAEHDIFRNGQYFVRIIAFNHENERISADYYLHAPPDQSSSTAAAKAAAVFDHYVDNRMMVGLDPQFQYVQTMEIALLQTAHEYHISDVSDSQFATVSTVEEMFDYYQSITATNIPLLEWSWLKQWPRWNVTQKLAKYETFISHELHLFLLHKDPKFFNDICYVHIQAKLHKDFMDHFFLNDTQTLKRYTEPYLFQRLNIVEQILLTRALSPSADGDAAFKQRVLQYFSNVFASISVPEHQIHHFILSALASQSDRTRDPASDPTRDPAEYPTPAPTSDPTRSPSSFEAKREQMQKLRLFEQIDATVEYQETYYWNVVGRNRLSIPANRFWCQYAMWSLNRTTGMTSPHFLSDWMFSATSSINEVLLALAVTDLSWKNDQAHMRRIYHDAKSVNHNVTLQAMTPTILFIQQIQQQSADECVDEDECSAADSVNQASSVLLHSHYFDPAERHAVDGNGEKIEKHVDPLSMQPLKVYGMSVILTAISSVAQRLNVLTQIPTGSLPVMGGHQTKVHFLRMNPYTVKRLEFHFYFPSIGTFQQYPVIVYRKTPTTSSSSAIAIVASSSPSQQYNHQIVVKQAATTTKQVLDVHSWDQVSLYGTDDDILRYLSTHNLHTTNLKRIFYKLKESKAFYDRVWQLCAEQHFYDSTIWSFQFYWLQNEQTLGTISKSELKMRVESVQQWLLHEMSGEDDKYRYLEYIPLINARAHTLGEQRQILNQQFKAQYGDFLKHVSLHSTSILDVPCTELLSAAYYLLLQDRFDEALDIYRIIQSDVTTKDESFASSLLFDYFDVYISIYEQSLTLESLRSKLVNVLQKYQNVTLIKSKAQLLTEMETLLTDITTVSASDLIDSDATQNRHHPDYSNQQPFLHFDINKHDQLLAIQSQNIDAFDVNFYVMNMEILFSKSPSLMLSKYEAKHSIFSYIRPNISMAVHINAEQQHTMNLNNIAIPDELRNENIFIEMVSSTLTVSQSCYDDQQIMVQLDENYGKLQIWARAKNEQPQQLSRIAGAYIKVYAFIDSEYEFYKDGYTDIRGVFDYASISTGQLDQTEAFIIFVTHTEHGTLIIEASTPKR